MVGWKGTGVLCNYTTAVDLFSHSRIVMGLRSVCVCLSVYYQIFYLLYLFINVSLLLLWLKRFLNLHILFVSLQHDNVYFSTNYSINHCFN